MNLGLGGSNHNGPGILKNNKRDDVPIEWCGRRSMNDTELRVLPADDSDDHL